MYYYIFLFLQPNDFGHFTKVIDIVLSFKGKKDISKICFGINLFKAFFVKTLVK